MLLTDVAAHAQKQVVLKRDNATVTLESYAPNIVRITMSLDKPAALAPPGYGISAQPKDAGWKYSHTATTDTYQSGQMKVEMPVPHYSHGAPPPDCDTCNYFLGSTPYIPLTVLGPGGKTLLRMEGWTMSVPNHKDGNAGILNDVKPSIAYNRYDPRNPDKVYDAVGATFFSPSNEHYYGLGENQQGYLDHRDHPIHCWNNYTAPAAPTFCVPFLVTNHHYAVLWDNPSKTTIVPGFNQQTKWNPRSATAYRSSSSTGSRLTTFYSGYALLTGSTPMLPKAAYGYIQCKQRYRSQAEVMGVANGYRDRHLPLDMIVVDWFYYTNMGQMDFNARYWPDPSKMNAELHKMGITTMISVWPRFVPSDRYYEMLQEKGWFMHLADGTPTNGLPLRHGRL